MARLRYLTADTALTLDGDAVLEAAASTRSTAQGPGGDAEHGAEHDAVHAEVAAVLAWCHAQQPQGHGPRDEGGLWHHDLQVGTEPGGWRSVHLTITGEPAFIEALLQAFFPPETD